MNARHDPQPRDEDGAREQQERQGIEEFALYCAGARLRDGIERGDAYARETVSELAALLNGSSDSITPWPDPPAIPPGRDPF